MVGRVGGADGVQDLPEAAGDTSLSMGLVCCVVVGGLVVGSLLGDVAGVVVVEVHGGAPAVWGVVVGFTMVWGVHRGVTVRSQL